MKFNELFKSNFDAKDTLKNAFYLYLRQMEISKEDLKKELIQNLEDRYDYYSAWYFKIVFDFHDKAQELVDIYNKDAAKNRMTDNVTFGVSRLFDKKGYLKSNISHGQLVYILNKMKQYVITHITFFEDILGYLWVSFDNDKEVTVQDIVRIFRETTWHPTKYYNKIKILRNMIEEL